MMRFRRTFLPFVAAVAITAGSSALAANAAAPTIDFNGTTVVVRDVVPGATVVFFGVASVFNARGYFYHVVRWHKVVTDEARSGTVTLDLGQPVPSDSAWFACDLSNGHYAGGRPQGAFVRSLSRGQPALIHDNSGDTFLFTRNSFDLLYLEPGHGAWSWMDVGRTPSSAGLQHGDGAAVLADAKPLTGAGVPARFSPGGYLFLIDNLTLDAQVLKIAQGGGLQ
jgi:hypothetical protein